MEHTNEQNLHTERYLLDEMSPEERQAFEEHFFNCRSCGEDVALAGRLMATGRKIAVDEDRARKVTNIADSPRWRQWVPQTVAASVITAFLTWSAVPARMPAISVAPGVTHTLQLAQDRGPGDAKPLPVRVPSVLYLDGLYHEDAASFVYTLRDSDGDALLKDVAVSLEESQQPPSIQLDALPRGSYEVVIEGVRKTDGNRFPVTKAKFEVID